MKNHWLNTDNFCELGYDSVSIDPALTRRVLDSILGRLPDTTGFADLKNGLSKNLDHLTKEGIGNITDACWQNQFGHLSQRLLDRPMAREFEKFVVAFFEGIPAVRRARLHKIRAEDIAKNPLLDKNLPSITYRIVRAGRKEDVGFPHRDSDFWIQGIDGLPVLEKNERRVKVWLGIYGLSEANTLCFFKGSHKDHPKVHYIEKFGKKKPVIDPEYLEANGENVESPYSKIPFMNIFHDRTIHFAPCTTDAQQKPLRISIECTVLILEESSIFL